MFTFIGILLLGWVSGGIINYLSDVLPYKRRLSQPICTACGATQSPITLILPYRCASCGKPKSLRWWLVNAITVLVCAILYLIPTQPLGFWLGFLLYCYFAIVMVIDIEHRLILFPVSIAGMVLGAALGIVLHGILATIIGGLAGFAIMYFLYYMGALFAKWMAKRRGQTIDEPALGFGDVMLSGVIGFVLGWPGIAAGLILGILFGGAFSLVVIVSHLVKKTYSPFMAIPYGPFLILGTMVLLYRF